MQVRRFEPSDAEELTDLLHRAYRELGTAASRPYVVGAGGLRLGREDVDRQVVLGAEADTITRTGLELTPVETLTDA